MKKTTVAVLACAVLVGEAGLANAQQSPALSLGDVKECLRTDDGRPVCRLINGRLSFVTEEFFQQFNANLSPEQLKQREEEQKAERARQLEQRKRQKAEAERKSAEEKAKKEAADRERRRQELEKLEQQRAEARNKGAEYAKSAGVTWSLVKTKSEMTDKVEVSAESIQKNDAGVTAQVKAFCSSDKSVRISALIVDSYGAPTISFADQNLYGKIPALSRHNDDPPARVILSPQGFRNEFGLAKLTGKAQRLSALFHPRDTTWRVLVQINTSSGPMIIKVPVYDDAMQAVIAACM